MVVSRSNFVDGRAAEVMPDAGRPKVDGSGTRSSCRSYPGVLPGLLSQMWASLRNGGKPPTAGAILRAFVGISNVCMALASPPSRGANGWERVPR
jgi:hypothetical protein